MREDLFPGEARPMPVDSSRGVAVFGPPDEAGLPDEVREAMRGPVAHARGYAAFAEAVGADARRLATDLAALVELLGRRPDLLADPATAAAADVFLGNAIAVARPGAQWLAWPDRDPELRAEGGSVTVGGLAGRLASDPALREAFLDGIPQWVAEDTAWQRRRELADRAMTGGPLIDPPRRYVRPWIDPAPFLDDDGRPYGDRRPDDVPGDWYSRVSRPERFAPLHTVADALLAYLRIEYDVAVTDERVDGIGTIRIVPTAGAPIELEHTDFPGLRLHTGAASASAYPACGCDACDEDWQGQAEQLEDAVLGVAAGGLTEFVTEDSVVTGLRTARGAGSSSGDRSGESLRATPPADGRWPAWPLRPH